MYFIKEIDKILKESIEIDKAEDEMYGDSTPYQMPKELVDKTKRLEKIKAAKKKLDEAKLEKINVTDNDAKIMKHKDGSLKPSYNGQIAVDDKEQVIVAADLVTDENDVNQVDPMIQLIWATMGYRPTILLADAGYFSYDNIELLNQIGTDSYIPDNFFKVEERGKSKYFLKSMFRFDKENDCYYCPAGITMPFKWIEKIGGFLKRKAKDIKEVLRKGISGSHIENIGEIVVNCADKISILSGIMGRVSILNSN